MGYGSLRRLVQVELPLAMPLIMAGIRIATVTTIGLVMVTALIGFGGLGQADAPWVQLPQRHPRVSSASS